MSDAPVPPAGADENVPTFHIETLYLKDLSFESPNVPDIFRDNHEPRVEFGLDTQNVRKGPDHWEVVLQLSLKVTSKEKALFLVEMSYGGVFLLKNIPDQHLPMVLGVDCPNVLFPYARQLISQVVVLGGFKPLILDPVNFFALMQQKTQQQQARAAAAAEHTPVAGQVH
ncbi:MAG: protein-export chaperone SecB [Magnetococcales bacterium]|nr:protein-export chaperone SecB [Magnetococcales bacterium]